MFEILSRCDRLTSLALKLEFNSNLVTPILTELHTLAIKSQISFRLLSRIMANLPKLTRLVARFVVVYTADQQTVDDLVQGSVHRSLTHLDLFTYHENHDLGSVFTLFAHCPALQNLRFHHLDTHTRAFLAEMDTSHLIMPPLIRHLEIWQLPQRFDRPHSFSTFITSHLTYLGLRQVNHIHVKSFLQDLLTIAPLTKTLALTNKFLWPGGINIDEWRVCCKELGLNLLEHCHWTQDTVRSTLDC